MVVSVKHVFQSAKGDTPDATLVQPSNWNAEHEFSCSANSVLGRGSSSGSVQEIPTSAVGRAVMAAATTTAGREAIEAASATALTNLTGRVFTAGSGLLGGGSFAEDREFSIAFATTTQWRAAVEFKTLDAKTVWDAMAEVSLTDESTIAWNMGAGFDFIVTLGGNRTMAAPTNAKVGQKGRLIIQQDGTGSRTLAWNSVFDFANGVAPTLSTAASVRDYLYYDVRSATQIFISLAGRAVA